MSSGCISAFLLVNHETIVGVVYPFAFALCVFIKIPCYQFMSFCIWMTIFFRYRHTFIYIPIMDIPKSHTSKRFFKKAQPMILVSSMSCFSSSSTNCSISAIYFGECLKGPPVYPMKPVHTTEIIYIIIITQFLHSGYIF